MPHAKHRKVVVTIEEKLEIVALIQRGTSHTGISEKYRIAWTTVADTKKNWAKLEVFKQRMRDMVVKKVDTKAMKLGAYENLDDALYICFKAAEEERYSSEWQFASRKAKILYACLYPDSPMARTGVQWCFSKQHGLKSHAVQGEQASADVVSACDFQHHFS